MKKAFFLFLTVIFIFSSTTHSGQIHSKTLIYTVKPIFTEKETALYVEIEFQGNSSGKTALILPSQWAGQEKLYESLYGIKIISENARMEETKRPHVKTLYHNPGEVIKLEYKGKQTWSGEISGQRHQKYRPKINRDYFHFVGKVFFAHPVLTKAKNLNFDLRWENFPKDWIICNTFGSGKSRQNFMGSINRIKDGVYAGGDYRFKEIKIKDFPVVMALRGRSWNFSDREFFDLMEKILLTERGFWKDYDFPSFFILLTPFGFNHKNCGGSALFRSFDVFFYSDSDLNFDFKRLFAHELFHSWNPRKLGRLKHPEQLLYWISEGFTDYYTRLLLLRAGLISVEEYVFDFNRKLKKYYRSPVKEAPNQKILEEYWTDDHVGKLPYQRGDLMAHRWNTILKNSTQNKYSLDDVMLDLFQASQEKQQIITRELVAKKITSYADFDAAKEIQKYIIEGNLINLEGTELGPCYELYFIKDGEENRIPQYKLKPEYSTLTEKAKIEWFK
jgi:predicted metalloprotease with PDZ domain